jgi:hypothetical protein
MAVGTWETCQTFCDQKTEANLAESRRSLRESFGAGDVAFGLAFLRCAARQARRKKKRATTRALVSAVIGQLEKRATVRQV